MVPVFVRDGKCESHVNSGAGGKVQLQIEYVEKCLEDCGQELGRMGLFVNTRGPEPDRYCAEAEGRNAWRKKKGQQCISENRINWCCLPSIPGFVAGWMHRLKCPKMSEVRSVCQNYCASSPTYSEQVVLNLCQRDFNDYVQGIPISSRSLLY